MDKLEFPIHAPLGPPAYTSWMGRHGIGFINPMGIALGAWYQANRAHYVPFRTGNQISITQLWCFNGAVGGNIDMGIYDRAGTRLVSTGSTAMAGANQMQKFTLGTALRIGPGMFYVAMAVDSTGNTFTCITINNQILRGFGVVTEDGGFPLPANATWGSSVETREYIFGFYTSE